MSKCAIKVLEDWCHSDKAHWYEIATDDGFGAGCIEVVLHKGKKRLAFTDAELMRREKLDDWPGLGRTIIAAVEEAEKKWAKPKAKPKLEPIDDKDDLPPGAKVFSVCGGKLPSADLLAKLANEVDEFNRKRCKGDCRCND